MLYGATGLEYTLGTWWEHHPAGRRRDAVADFCQIDVLATPHDMADGEREPLEDTGFFKYTVPVPGAEVVVSYVVFDGGAVQKPVVCFNRLLDLRTGHEYGVGRRPPT